MAENTDGSMGTAPGVPAWLLDTFVEAIRHCGSQASDDEIMRQGHALLELWFAPGRCYHDSGYLKRVISAVDELSAVAHTPDLLRLAVWYGGMWPPRAVRHPGSDMCSDQNETCHQISTSLHDLGVDGDLVERICQLECCAMRRSAPTEDVDATTLVDATMCDLAATPQEYKRYRQALRAEYAHLSDVEFFHGRRAHVRQMLQRPAIFLSPAGMRWEVFARQNMEAELANLEKVIAELEPSDSSLMNEDAFSASTVPAYTVPAFEPPCGQTIIKKVGARTATSAESERSKDSSDTAKRNETVSDTAKRSKDLSNAANRSKDPSDAIKHSETVADAAKHSKDPSDGAKRIETVADTVERSEDSSDAPKDPSADSTWSSLESEPELLTPQPKQPVRRLSAKEQAREAARQARQLGQQ